MFYVVKSCAGGGALSRLTCARERNRVPAFGRGRFVGLVIMTGASGSGKTAIAETIEANHPSITVFRFDTIGVPSAAVMATFATGYQPGGAWQRSMTFEWLERIAPMAAEFVAFLPQ